jgi:predicted ATPase
MLQASSVSYGKPTPYRPVVDLLKGYFQIEGGDGSQRVREKVTGRVLAINERLKDAIPPILSLLEALPEDDPFRELGAPLRRGRTIGALKQLVLRESQRKPLCVVFEDLHWIDTETQAALDHLVEGLPTGGCFCWPATDRSTTTAGLRKRTTRGIRIDPLPPESAEELLDALRGHAASLRQLKQLFIEWTEGNPFFLEESVRTVVDTRVLAGRRGEYHLTRPVESVQVPATVQAVLAARIDRLPPEEKRLLQEAAVVGKDVPVGLLRAVSQLTEDEVRAPPGRTHRNSR